MSHVVGTVQPVTPGPFSIGPDFASSPSPTSITRLDFGHDPAPGGTKFLILHFRDVSLPANNRLEVELGYGNNEKDVFTAADGPEFWTRPVNPHAFPGGLVPVRYVADGAATGRAVLDRYGRGERHNGMPGHTSFSNCDPFLNDGTYLEPQYDPTWFCSGNPNWENVACVAPASDVRARVARSVGMIVSVGTDGGFPHVSSCSVTLVGENLIVTAGHCIEDTDLGSISVTFDYQTDCAGGRPPSYRPKFFKVKTLKRSSHVHLVSDHALFELAEVPPGVPVAQVRPHLLEPSEQVFGIHHPNGAVKKLSVPHPRFSPVLKSDEGGVRVPSDFHVSGGSSGSGLFDTAGRLVGILSHGEPCDPVHPSPLWYAPVTPLLRELASTPPPPPPMTRDVTVVVDRSGSMQEPDGAGRSKFEAARDAVSLFIQMIRSDTGNRVGLVSFSTAASTDAGIANVTKPGKEALIGPAPHVGGKVGALPLGGFTSIGAALEAARLQFPAPGANPRAILLLTDGMQNTPPMVKDVEAGLAGIELHVVGLGTEANLDGALLNQLATTHGGRFSRAQNGLWLQKFFSQAFGNIFEAGLIMDPEFDLPEDQRLGETLSFQVCGEEALTVVVGWDRTDELLLVELTTPGGTKLVLDSPGTEGAAGETWTFLRVPLPHAGERDGVWRLTPFRPAGGGEFPPPAPALRYFVNVIPSGGPRLIRAADRKRRYYTGDPINPLVMLRYPDGSWPRNGKARVSVSCPDVGAGNLLTAAKLGQASEVGGDAIPARQATLTALENAAGGPLVSYAERAFELGDESWNTEGTFGSAALFGKPIADLLEVEGDYTFHFRSSYGEVCTTTRELFWSLHVAVGIDPAHTDVTVKPTKKLPGGKQAGTIVVIPRDRNGNHLGPGHGGDITVEGAPGTTVTGPPQDNGDGSYTVPVVWVPGSPSGPGLVIGQPERPPIVVYDPKASKAPWWKQCFLCWLLLLIALVLLILLLVLLLS